MAQAELGNLVTGALAVARQHPSPAVAAAAYLQVSGGLAEYLFGYACRVSAAMMVRIEWVRGYGYGYGYA